MSVKKKEKQKSNNDEKIMKKDIEIFLTKIRSVYLLNGPDVRTFNE